VIANQKPAIDHQKSKVSNAHWLALTTIPGIGGVTARKMIERFGDVESIFAVSFDELIEIPRITPAVAERLLAAPVETLESDPQPPPGG
jgi:excinuclease UvrABC nuclease subunit